MDREQAIEKASTIISEHRIGCNLPKECNSECDKCAAEALYEAGYRLPELTFYDDGGLGEAYQKSLEQTDKREAVAQHLFYFKYPIMSGESGSDAAYNVKWSDIPPIERESFRKSADRFLSLLTPELKVEWIDVRDRLPQGQWNVNHPQLSEEVLIANSCSVNIGFYNRDNGTWYVDEPAKKEWIDKITHWMPLPINWHDAQAQLNKDKEVKE